MTPTAGSAWLCEVRPVAHGNGYEIVSRTRVLGWKIADGQMLPVTMSGPVPLRAFAPSVSAPQDGCCFIELRSVDGARCWTTPYGANGKEFGDENLKRLMHQLRSGELVRKVLRERAAQNETEAVP